MHFSTVTTVAFVVFAPLAHAHGTGFPKLIGVDPADGRNKDLVHTLETRFLKLDHAHSEPPPQVRQSPLECGPGVGSCSTGKCCSRSFYCGTTSDHCYSPGCNYKYGPGCAENNPPAGSDTSSIPRIKVGTVPYGGAGIFQCTKPGTVALTYDDGPQKRFTEHILDQFKSYDAKATFFVTGNSIKKGQIDIEYAGVIKRMDSEGHQIASHTWTHLDLSKINTEDRKNQIIMNEMAIRNIIGKIPTYLRPPYSSCTETSGCQRDIADLGYHITNFNIDTDDYNQNKPEHIQIAKNNFLGNITKTGTTAQDSQWLSIGHDILEQTANNLTGYMLETITKLGYKAVTVGECLGDPKKNWYRAANDAGLPAHTSNNGSNIPSDSMENINRAVWTSTSKSNLPGNGLVFGAASSISSSSIVIVSLVCTIALAFLV